ncbi:YjbH domain-containing protein, partial [Idiomarina abyssalis]|uniref:YjbH domain-containing protein n=1 Tax=Idiomarina abyssalis TaxID=86102 RepID=UPI003A8D6755
MRKNIRSKMKSSIIWCTLKSCSILTFGAFVFGSSAYADDLPPMALERSKTLSYNLFGAPGLIDMPTAETAQDGDLAISAVRFGGTTRTNLTFQITPRLSGSFRYSKIDPYSASGALYDRSFDLKYQLAEEGNWRPAIAIGLQDFIGTSVYSGEYLVATKHLTSSFALTGGLGWGRLASYGTFSNPLSALDDHFDTRTEGFEGRGGEPDPGRWFTGDAAFFGGAAWRAT